MVLFDDLYVGIFFFGGGNYFVRCKAYMWEHFGMDICMQDIFFFFFFFQRTEELQNSTKGELKSGFMVIQIYRDSAPPISAQGNVCSLKRPLTLVATPASPPASPYHHTQPPSPQPLERTSSFPQQDHAQSNSSKA